MATKITGTSGNDILTGTSGSDTIDGGAGIDTVVESGTYSQHHLSKVGSSWTVTGGATGTDILTNVEYVRFSDATYSLSTGKAISNALTPTLTASAASGASNTAIPLAIAASFVNTTSIETMAVLISGMPSGATLSAGTHNADGSWSLTPAQLSGLTVTPPANSTAAFTLSVKATVTDPVTGTTAVTTASEAVTVHAATSPPPATTVSITTANGVTTATGTSGNDTIDLSSITTLKNTVNGGAGTDTVILPYSESWYQFSTDSQGNAIAKEVHASGQTTTLTGVEQLQFTGSAGQTYDTSGHLIGTGSTGTGSTGTGSTGTPPATVSITTANGVTTATGTSGNDTIDLSAITTLKNTVNGGAGTDTVILPYSESWYQFSTDSQGNAIATEAHASGQTTTLTGVEQLQFTGSAGQTYDTSGHLIGTGSTGTGSTGTGSTGTGSTGTGSTGTPPATVSITTANGVTTAVGTSGDDTIDLHSITTLTDTVNGGAGTDTVILPNSESWYQFSTDSQGNAVVTEAHASGQTTTLTGVEQLQFTGSAGQTYDTSGHLIGTGSTGTGSTGTGSTGTGSTGTGSTGTGSTGTGSTGSGSTSSDGDVFAPTVLHASQTGDIVGFQLDNLTSSVEKAGVVSFGQVFADGDVMATDHLHARINGVDYAVQMDVKTTRADGSVSDAILSVAAPDIAAKGALDGMLVKGAAAGAPTTAITANDVLSHGYDLKAGITVHNADGTNSAYTVDGAAVLQAAITNHTVQTWMNGPESSEFRVETQVTPNLTATLDIRLDADGQMKTDVIFGNENTFTSANTVKYDATITEGGQTLFSDSNITQYRNSTWHQEVWAPGVAAGVNQSDVIFDMSYLEKTGAIPAYDTSVGVSATTINANNAALAAANTGPMGAALVDQAMPSTGGRPDIGPTTAWSADYIVSQDPGAKQVMLANADAAGSVPWHFVDESTGAFVRIDQHPNMWIDYRGPTSGPDALTTPFANVDTTTGWSLDMAHTPDLSYVAYLTTGDHYYLDQEQAQTSWRLGAENYRDTVGVEPVRQVAWGLRDIANAAFITPDSDPLKAYFTSELNYKLGLMETAWIAGNNGEGAVSGWIPDGDKTITDPWMQDFLAITLNDLSQQGFTAADPLAQWMTNFVAGLYTNGANGFDPAGGATYNLDVMSNGTPLQTWAQVWAATYGTTAPTPDSIGGYPGLSTGYDAVAKAALASLITENGSPMAIQAYGMVVGQMAAGGGLSTYDDDPTWAIMPKMPDGHYLQNGDIHVGGASAVTLTAGANDSLLMGGAGGATMVGGAGNDYLFGGKGADTFVFTQPSGGHDTAIAFDLSADVLQIKQNLNGDGQMTATDVINAATTNSHGDTVLHFSSNADVTLMGITLDQLKAHTSDIHMIA